MPGVFAALHGIRDAFQRSIRLVSPSPVLALAWPGTVIRAYGIVPGSVSGSPWTLEHIRAYQCEVSAIPAMRNR